MARNLREMLAEAERRWAERRFAEHMSRCEAAWRTGVTAAFVDAVTWCRVFQKPPPAWVDEAAHQVVTQRQTKAEAKRRYELAIHFVRWDAVTELRKRRRELSESRNDIEPDMSWERCYEVAAQHLASTGAAGSAATIAASYKMVQADIKKGRGPQYYIPMLRG